VAEHKGRRFPVHERDRDPRGGAVPPTAGDEGVHVRVPAKVVPERLHHGDHAGPQQTATRCGGTDDRAGALVRGAAQPTQKRAVVEEVWLGISFLN
jgi:hypothetical protein